MRKLSLICLVLLSCSSGDHHQFTIDNNSFFSEIHSTIESPYRLELLIKSKTEVEGWISLQSSTGLTSTLNISSRDTSFLIDWYDSFCRIDAGIEMQDSTKTIEGELIFY